MAIDPKYAAIVLRGEAVKELERITDAAIPGSYEIQISPLHSATAARGPNRIIPADRCPIPGPPTTLAGIADQIFRTALEVALVEYQETLQDIADGKVE
jgi:hypothetical protein